MKNTLVGLSIGFILVFVVTVPAQKQRAPIIVSKSRFVKIATDFVFSGTKCEPIWDLERLLKNYPGRFIRDGDLIFYPSVLYFRGRTGDGLVAEDLAKKTCTWYSMRSLQESQNWVDQKQGKVPESIRGLHKVGNRLWMGSNGIGILFLDVSAGRWTRYDIKTNGVPGAHISVDFADEDYVFISTGEFPAAGMHIMSVKSGKWLRLDSVSTANVSEWGYTTGTVQVQVDHRAYKNAQYLPIDWTLAYPEISYKDGAYVLTTRFETNRTTFAIDKRTLDDYFTKK